MIQDIKQKRSIKHATTPKERKNQISHGKLLNLTLITILFFVEQNNTYIVLSTGVEATDGFLGELQ